MTGYLARRIPSALLAVLATTVVASYLIHLVPGDPVRLLFSESQATSEAQIEAIRRSLGLHLPLHEQYFLFLGKLLQGDLGTTIRGGQPVLELILGRLPVTLTLASCSLLIAAAVGLTLGFFAAYKQGSWIDTSLMVTAILGVSVPHFWLGLILISVFSITLGWLPIASGDWRSFILPSVTLGLTSAAIVARLTRSAMIEIFAQDYIRTAYAKGLKRGVVLSRHALRAGLVPIVTMLGLQFGYMMGGAVIVENVFSLNGVGRLAVQAILQRDFPMIQGFILIFSLVIVSLSLILDLVYMLLDPRIRKAT